MGNGGLVLCMTGVLFRRGIGLCWLGNEEATG